MSEYLDRARKYHEAIRRILLREWDPIGVGDVPTAQDKYDAYVGQVYGMLIRHGSQQKVFEFLWMTETEHMGLFGNRQQTERVAHRLIELREEIEGHP